MLLALHQAKEEEDAGDQDALDEASTLLQSTSSGSAPSKIVSIPELCENDVKLHLSRKESLRRPWHRAVTAVPS